MPRPPNPWILFRSDKCIEFGSVGRVQKDFTKELAKLWKEASDEVKAYYQEKAK